MNKTPSVQFVLWSDIKQSVNDVNPLLAECLEALNPSSNEYFVQVNYSFGHSILKMGKLTLPTKEGQSEFLDQLSLAHQELNQINYANCPLGLLLNNSVEAYYEIGERIISDKIFQKGAIFGADELFDQKLNKNKQSSFHLSAGARSIFMLPKISDWVSYSRLKKILHIQKPPPTTLAEHRDFFSDITEKGKDHEAEPWQCSILFFTQGLINKLLSKAGHELQLHLFGVAWDRVYHCRRQFENNVSWERVLKAINSSSTYLRSKIHAHLKQILLIKEGVFPGMVFASEKSEEMAPIKLIQKIYSDIYRLKDYAPILMHPANIFDSKIVYYSLNYPSYFDIQVPAKSGSRFMDELHLIAELIKDVAEHIGLNSNTLKLFHSMANNSNVILDSKQLVSYDKSLSDYFSQNAAQLFPSNSPFFKGCIRISKLAHD